MYNGIGRTLVETVALDRYLIPIPGQADRKWTYLGKNGMASEQPYNIFGLCGGGIYTNYLVTLTSCYVLGLNKHAEMYFLKG